MKKLYFIFLISCSPLIFRIDPSFTTIEVNQIQKAADKWNSVTIPAKKITIDPKGNWVIDEVESVPGGWNGMCARSTKTILIDSDPSGASTYAVALHEFGHALGLSHTTNGVMQDGPSILKEGKTVTSEFAVEDMVECRRVKACK